MAGTISSQTKRRRPPFDLSVRRSLWLLILAFLFLGISLLQLALVNSNLTVSTFTPLLVLVICSGATIYFLQIRSNRPVGDPVLLPLTFFLSGLGLALIGRLAPQFVDRQLFWLGLATLSLLLINLIPKDLNWLRRYKYSWLTGGILLLASTLVFGVNPSGYGARLWLRVGDFFFFQPSELLKLLLIVFLAAYLADRRRELVEVKIQVGRLSLPHPSYFGPMLMMWGFSMVLLIWQRDLGAALLFFGTFLGMLYAATGNSRYIWLGALLLMVAGFVGYHLFDVVRIRVDGFLDPWVDPSGRSFQIVQSLLAFTSGGFLGQGLGQGLPTAIPVVHTDFVYAAVGEEYGLLGALGVLVCFVLLVGRAFHIGQRAGNEFEQFLALGIGTMLALQTLVITAGVLKLMPLTGVTLPLVSYGGSSLVISFTMIGLLHFIAQSNTVQESEPSRQRAAVDAVRSNFSMPTYGLKLAKMLFVGFSVVAGGLVLWQIAAAPFLVSREDNPRLVIAEQEIERGRLLTRDGVPIAESIVTSDGLVQRHYPYPSLSSVTGYYSIRYGVGGTEATFDPILRGVADQTAEEKFMDDLLHRPLVGQDVTLTIDLPAQAAADAALDDREGAVVLMEIDTGAILVMSSHPTYDPNTLDQMWDSLRDDERAPLVNRATQGLFPVGDLARLVALIGLHEAGADLPPDPAAAPLDELAGPLGTLGYSGTARQLGLARPVPDFRSQPGRLPNFEDRGTVRDLAATPLHLARVIAALELEGQLPTPVLSPDHESQRLQSFKPTTAHAVRAQLSQIDAQLIGLSGQATPEETGQMSLSWFVGLAPATTLPVENYNSPALSEQGLILDPTKIEAAAATSTPATTDHKAQYVVVTVVVTETPENQPALQIAKAPLRVLLGSPLE